MNEDDRKRKKKIKPDEWGGIREEEKRTSRGREDKSKKNQNKLN